jgi:hypothetical protein
MRLVQLTDLYILDVDDVREAWLEPSDGDVEAKFRVRFKSGQEFGTILSDDEAITAWHRLRDLCSPGVTTA